MRLGGSGAALGGTHPAVSSRRTSDLVATAIAVVLTFALGIAATAAVPKPNYELMIALIFGVIAIAALIMNPRLELSVAFLFVFIGCLAGPVKLIGNGGVITSGLQDVLVAVVFIATLVRHVRAGNKLTLPPMSAWVLAYVGVALLEAFNPRTHGLLKIGAGLRQQLQWVPFFLFGYLVVRTKQRLRAMFILLGVVALLNGLVSSYQTQLSPEQIAQWGPGYAAKIENGRVYKSEGEGHVRPTGLGQESGTGAGFGVIAVAGTFALLLTSRGRRRWWALLLAIGSLAAIATGLGRLQLVGGFICVMAFGGLAVTSGMQVGRTMFRYIGAIAVLAVAGVFFVNAIGAGIFKRYESVSPEKVATTATSYKQAELSTVPHELEVAPFGFGLGITGSAGNFGGKVTESLEGHRVGSETQFNFLADEVGIPGILVWSALTVQLMLLAVRRIRQLRDHELQIYMAAVFAPIVAHAAMAFDGPVGGSISAAPFYWFATGVAGYWFVGKGWELARKRPETLPSMQDEREPAPGGVALA